MQHQHLHQHHMKIMTTATATQQQSNQSLSSCARRISCDNISVHKEPRLEGNEENQPTQPRVTSKGQLVTTPLAPSTAKAALSSSGIDGPDNVRQSATATPQSNATESTAASPKPAKAANATSPNAADAANALSNLQKFCLIAQDYEETKPDETASPPSPPPQQQQQQEPSTPPPMAVPTPSPTEHVVTADHRSSPPKMMRDIPPECPPMPNNPPHHHHHPPSYNYHGRPLQLATPLPPPPPHGCYPPHSAARSYYGRMTATPIHCNNNGANDWQRPFGVRQPDPPSWHSPHPHGAPPPFGPWNRNLPPPPQQQQPEGGASGLAPRCTCGDSHNQQAASPSNKSPSPSHWRQLSQHHGAEANRGMMNSMQPQQIRWGAGEPTNQSCASSKIEPAGSSPWQPCICGKNQAGLTNQTMPPSSSSSSPPHHYQQKQHHHQPQAQPQQHQPPATQQRPQLPHHQASSPWNGYKELDGLLAHVSPGVRSAIWGSVDRIVSEHVMEYRRAATGFMHNSSEFGMPMQNSNNMPVPKRASNEYNFGDVAPSVVTMSRKRGVGGDDLELRRDLKKMKMVRDKVLLLQQIQSKVQKEGLEDSKLTEGARTFVCRSLRPIMGCFTKHCNSDLDRFCGKWPKLAISSFACNGNRQECIIGDSHEENREEEEKKEPEASCDK